MSAARGERTTPGSGLVVLGCALLLSSLTPSFAEAQPPGRVLARWIARADALVAAGHEARAAPILRRAARRAPEDARAPLRLAGLLVPADPSRVADPSAALRRAAEEARAALDRVVAVDDATRADLARARAWTIAASGDHREAAEIAGGAMGRLDAASARALRDIAAVAVHRRDLEAASRAIELAERAAPEDVSLASDRAAIELARGRPDRAIPLVRRVLERRPDDLRARRDLAGALLASGAPESALRILSAIAAQHDTDATDPRERARCHLDVARAALEAGDAARAERAARAALRHAPETDPSPARLLALALVAQSRRPEAADAFREALRRDPTDSRSREGLTGITAE